MTIEYVLYYDLDLAVAYMIEVPVPINITPNTARSVISISSDGPPVEGRVTVTAGIEISPDKLVLAVSA